MSATGSTGGTVVVVGAGQAGFQAAASLREAGYHGRVMLVGDEPEAPYQRPPLSKAYLAGGAEAALHLRPAKFYAEGRIEIVAGERVVEIERGARRVRLGSGGTLGYDHLVLALGARNRVLPVPGAELDGVLSLRSLADARALRERLATARSAVVVGGGFIGLEFAAVAIKRGVAVTVIEAALRPMARALSLVTSTAFGAHHAAAGVRFLYGTGVARILGEGGRVTAVEAGDGGVIPADLVLVGIGVVPNAELAGAAGLPVADGILVDEHLLTADPAISAIGDCARYPSLHAGAPTRLESVQNAVDHARAVAARLTGQPQPYAGLPWFWSDQGALRLQIAGLTAGHDAVAVRGAPESGMFSVFCFRAGRLLGVESVNRPVEHMAARKLLTSGVSITPDQAADPLFDLKAYAANPARVA